MSRFSSIIYAKQFEEDRTDTRGFLFSSEWDIEMVEFIFLSSVINSRRSFYTSHELGWVEVEWTLWIFENVVERVRVLMSKSVMDKSNMFFELRAPQKLTYY